MSGCYNNMDLIPLLDIINEEEKYEVEEV